MTQPIIKRLLIAVVLLPVLYGLLCGGLFWAMSQSPDRFGWIMSYVPGPAMAVLPFRSFWMVARAGDLDVGDLAPDFELPTYDKKDIVRLSGFRGKSPVVLVFGSYT